MTRSPNLNSRMPLLCAFIPLLTTLFAVQALGSEFVEPWKDPSIALVIDPFYANEINWNEMEGEARLVGIIHKATIGATALDPKYNERRAEAKRRGYLWGSYHWGVPGNPEQQADFYIDTVKPADDEVIALDLEGVTSKKFMSIGEAVKFIARIKERTGRYPVVYANYKTAAVISTSPWRVVFANTPLWYARFRVNLKDFPLGPWTTYTLWQFSSEILVQYRVPGTRFDMDVNVFNGSVEKLREVWPFTRRVIERENKR